MAQQITIDIVAETQKLTQGVNNVKGELGKLSTGISGVQQQAVGLASAFILTKGVSFLKKASEEAIDAEKTAKAAASAFGEGSTALQKITDDATKFADQLAIDNDDIIKLATGLGVRLPKDAQGASAELVLLAKNLEASSGGAIAAESTLSKLGKAYADGQVTAKELAKIVPGLTQATYDHAESLSKAGKNQEAMTLLIEAGQKRFGNAAADQVTGTQRMDKAMGDLYEMIGTNVAPIVEKLTKFLSNAVEWIIKNKGEVIPLVTVLGGFAGVILALNAGFAAYNAIMSAWKIATGIATTVQGIFNAVMAANPIALVVLAIVALIAIIVLLVKNWDTVTEVVGKVWNAIKDFAKNAWDAISGFVKSAIDAFGNFLSNVGGFVEDVVKAIFGIPGRLVQAGKDMVTSLWNGVSNSISWLTNNVSSIGSTIYNKFKNGLSDFKSIGEDIINGLISGITSKVSSVVKTVVGAVGNIISAAKSALGSHSPSKVFAEIGRNVVIGMANGISDTQDILKTSAAGLGKIAVNSLNLPSGGMAGASGINITINAGLGTDPIALGRSVNTAIKKYGRVTVK